ERERERERERECVCDREREHASLRRSFWAGEQVRVQWGAGCPRGPKTGARPSTLNPQPSTLNLQPSTIKP
ncbi:hypothetical protein T484DRAFT_3333745, partial [Baffinella frigidus]